MSQLSQSLQVEEIDVVTFAESVQTTTALRMPSLHDEKLPKVAHNPSLTRTSSSTRANVLGPKAQHFLPIVTDCSIFRLSLSSRLLLAIKAKCNRAASKKKKKRKKRRIKKKERKRNTKLFLPLYEIHPYDRSASWCVTGDRHQGLECFNCFSN